ncbi:MAG: His/Gly/Thr/Pro-type tRNA ligase C-terminal domain-containing protein, partial [Myxococcota bacterium]
LLDDRDERAGTKFHAAEVLAIPIVVVAGKRAAQDGFEVRRGAAIEMVAPEALAEHVDRLQGSRAQK